MIISPPQIMAVLNLTPDSFSDGGKFNSPQKALTQLRKLEKEGADIIDLGAEATGPGSKKVTQKEELNRLLSALNVIRKNTKLPISIDTNKAEVARQALEEGADIINDVTAFRNDPKMATVIAKYQCPVIIMYAKDKTPRTTIKNKTYKDVIQTIKEFFTERLAYAKSRNISNIILDPGMGHYISSIPEFSYEIITRLAELQEFQKPILIGVSRKSLLGGELATRDTKGPAVESIAYLNGASIIRTHNVKNTRAWLTWMSQ